MTQLAAAVSSIESLESESEIRAGMSAKIVAHIAVAVGVTLADGALRGVLAADAERASSAELSLSESETSAGMSAGRAQTVAHTVGAAGVVLVDGALKGALRAASAELSEVSESEIRAGISDAGARGRKALARAVSGGRCVDGDKETLDFGGPGFDSMSPQSNREGGGTSSMAEADAGTNTCVSTKSSKST